MVAAKTQSRDPAAGGSGPHLVLYDGECGLCHGLVQFVLPRDLGGLFHFASLQGPSPDISYPFCCDWLQARLAALSSRSSPDSMSSYSPAPNRFGRLASRAFAASRDEQACNIRASASIHLARFGGVPSRLSTVYLVAGYRGDHPECLVKARAALSIAKFLGWPWRAASLFAVLPTAWLDWGYDLVARNRHRLLGRREACLMPRPKYRDRFLDLQQAGAPGGKETQ